MAGEYDHTGAVGWTSDDTSSVTNTITYTDTNDIDYSYGGDVQEDNAIEVKKGSPGKAKYAVFYAVKKHDPVYFEGNVEDVKKLIRKLRKDEDVDSNSIRVFKLMSPLELI